MNQSTPALQQRISTLRWALPLALGVLSTLYQLGPARWVHDAFSHSLHYGVEILLYGFIGPLAVYGTVGQVGRWVAEKEQAEHRARTHEQRLASITGASADAILGLDAAGRIDSWNHGAELIFGYQAGEIQNQPLTLLFGDGEAAEVEYHWLVERVQREGFVRGHETTGRDADGRQVAVELTATQLAGELGQWLGMSVILRDVTERQRREQEIRRLNAGLNEQVAERTGELAEKVEQLARANAGLQKLDRMRSEFVSLVSHQLRAPLTNMHGAVEHIEANCGAMNATCIRMLSILNQQTDRLDRLVRDVLNAARIEAGELVLQPEPISVTPIVQQALEHVRARAGKRRFHLPPKPGLPFAFADRDRTAEVLANLLDNADKYSPRDKEITVEMRADETEVTLSVRDGGPGIPPAELERIFDKFHRADGSDSQAAYGYGLGLYVCRRIVEAQGGRIWAENAPGGGAVFSFTLPVAQG
ncbi:MAG: PAS domain S-box protein [Chloroflexi bacterium]|nr:PAS domain S-box protein [Chloroflexota bacterium]